MLIVENDAAAGAQARANLGHGIEVHRGVEILGQDEGGRGTAGQDGADLSPG